MNPRFILSDLLAALPAASYPSTCAGRRAGAGQDRLDVQPAGAGPTALTCDLRAPVRTALTCDLRAPVRTALTCDLRAPVRTALMCDLGAWGREMPDPEDTEDDVVSSGEDEQPLSILVADDDDATRRMLELALSRRGYQVETVGGGEAAIRRLRERPFDVTITDIHMPDVDGLALAEVARSIRPGMGLVLITAFGTEESITRAFRDGAAAFLKKPLQLPVLYRTIRLVAESSVDLPPEPVELHFGRGPEEATRLLELEIDDEGWVNFAAPSHRAFLDRFANLCELLLARGLDTDTVEELRVAILELGSNAIEWGHGHDVTRPIRLSARLLSDRLVVVVEDCGSGFCLADVPDPSEDARSLQRERQAEGKRPGGYGIALVRAITDHLVYNERGNLVAMVKKLRAKPAAG